MEGKWYFIQKKIQLSILSHWLDTSVRAFRGRVKPFLPRDKISVYSKLKKIAADQLKFAENMKSVSRGFENIVVKEENACYQHLTIIPTLYSKSFFFRVVKSSDSVRKRINLLPKSSRLMKWTPHPPKAPTFKKKNSLGKGEN